MYFLVICVLWAILPGNAVYGMDKTEQQRWLTRVDSRDDRTKAKHFIWEGFYDRAKPLLEAELNKNRDSEALFLMGSAEQGLQNYGAAEQYYEEALGLSGVSESMKSQIRAKLTEVRAKTKKDEPC